MNRCSAFMWTKRAGRIETPAFLAHLARCETCARERDTDRRLAALAARHPFRDTPRVVSRLDWNASRHVPRAQRLLPAGLTLAGALWATTLLAPDGFSLDVRFGLLAAVTAAVYFVVSSAIRRSTSF